MFQDLFTTKTARFIAITVVLGAIGSGAWEWILKPVIMSASNLGLNIATLGIQSFKDSLYKEIALGFHEEPSVKLYFAVFGLLPSFILGVISGGLAGKNRSGENGNTGNLNKLIDKIARPLLIATIFLLVFSVIQANQLTYVNRAITHFHTLLKITSPYLSEGQRLLYQSQFVQIESKNDYVKLSEELKNVCHAKNLRIPEFSIW